MARRPPGSPWSKNQTRQRLSTLPSDCNRRERWGSIKYNRTSGDLYKQSEDQWIWKLVRGDIKDKRGHILTRFLQKAGEGEWWRIWPGIENDQTLGQVCVCGRCCPSLLLSSILLTCKRTKTRHKGWGWWYESSCCSSSIQRKEDFSCPLNNMFTRSVSFVTKTNWTIYWDL